MQENHIELCVPEILVVDDMSANAEMVSLMLKHQGYKVRMASSGKLALKSIRDNPPDLILLDINMPEMDGYEVCGRIKADDKSKDVPVIFMSSLSEMMDKVKAFQVGGVDYVEKPFRIEEVMARIETHLKIRKLQRQLAHHNQHLEQLVQERTNQLAEAHRRLAIMDRTKSEFLALISHELRTPLNGVFGVAELLFDEDEKDPARRELMDMFNLSRKNMMNILDDALLLTQIEVSGNTFSPKAGPLGYILANAMASVKKEAHSRGAVVLPEFPPDGIDVQGDQKLLVKAFSSLLGTAAKFSSTEPVTVACKKLPSSVEVVISAKGRIIPADMLADFFDVFAASKAIKDVGELGLGPPVANRIILLFGGSVAVRNDDPAGVSFIVTCKTTDNA
jgi:DNA-binding response OmpR family regulator